MKFLSKLAASVMVALVFLGAACSVAAAAAVETHTITEEQINAAYWVTHPARRGVSDRRVDLQPNQVVLTETWTRRGGEPEQVVAIFVPRLEDGRVYWTLTAATVDGEPASPELLAQINTRISSAWANYFRRQLKAGRVTAIAIDDAAITLTVEREAATN
jgi:hypothetical protein